jgi:hypothetical protein
MIETILTVMICVIVVSAILLPIGMLRDSFSIVHRSRLRRGPDGSRDKPPN